MTIGLLLSVVLAYNMIVVPNPRPIEQVLKLGTEISDALDKAHRAGIVHRDLKPGNIMVNQRGEPVQLWTPVLMVRRRPA